MRLARVIVPTVLCAAVGAGAFAYANGDRVEVSFASSSHHSTDRHSGVRTPTASPSTTPSPTSTPTPSPTPTTVPAVDRTHIVLRPGDTGTRVRELQSRLYQLAWLPETTTGAYDALTTTAVKDFQAKRGLPRTGRLDDQTWHRLVAMTRQPSHDQMFNVLHAGPALYGPGSEGDDVRALQARLKDLDWYFGDVTGTYGSQTAQAVRGFQGKREIPVTGKVDRRTLERLQSMTQTPSHDAMFNIEPSPGALDARCKTGRVICIDKTSRTLRWVVDGKVKLTLDARFGSTLNDTPTREGLFHVYLMDADHVSHLYGSSMPFAMFFSGGQAVHYSSDFATYGYLGASHGCVNIRDYDGVKWLFSHVRVGDKVVVYWS
jgi:peptidoglycan hydrolase-like protein with peptidoglycan-binding domain